MIAAAIALIGGLVIGAATAQGTAIVLGVERFMLFYAGVFALIGLTAAVAVGLLASDRVLMTAGARITAQAMHRAVSFGAVAFLVIHIVLEVVAGRSGPADAVVPFLATARTLYAGLGTIASDLIVAIAVTSILRRRFAAVSRPWTWRAVHLLAYAAWPFAIAHGLLDGRTAKPYVDWSYGACLAVVFLALVVRAVVSGRGRHETAALPVPDRSAWPAEVGIAALPGPRPAEVGYDEPGYARPGLHPLVHERPGLDRLGYDELEWRQ